ncbi:hypothetical protein MIR68_004947 [Amoeboaphelidium protococcarum]|nr:hypothetical protein MIR68_004947 [Amoeboaphelidium protococcarum]
MPCILKIKVVAARDLPVMDKSSDNTDSYVEIRLAAHQQGQSNGPAPNLPLTQGNANSGYNNNSGGQYLNQAGGNNQSYAGDGMVNSHGQHVNNFSGHGQSNNVNNLPSNTMNVASSSDILRTSIQWKTLNPIWNEDFRIECSDDAEVQDEVLEFKVLDYDNYSANDSIGVVYIDLSPLITLENKISESDVLSKSTDRQSLGNLISGWFPIYDTIRGSRGELNLQIRIEYFGDTNPFKDSSAGVLIFSGGGIPEGYRIQEVQGLVTSIVCMDDPEYHWADSFRSPRISNEARQKLLCRMCGQLRRFIGREALELKGNAIIGYKQYFDFENEESVITGRVIGTCVTLVPDDSDDEDEDADADEDESFQYLDSPGSDGNPYDASFSQSGPGGDVDQSAKRDGKLVRSPSDDNKQQQQQQQGDLFVKTSTNALLPSSSLSKRPVRFINNDDDVVIMTLNDLPTQFIKNIGGIVSAKSVKLFDENTDEDEDELRDAWWDELREEIETHAKALNCQFVLGYEESVTICDDLCVLSVMGTAVNLRLDADASSFPPATYFGESNNNENISLDTSGTGQGNQGKDLAESGTSTNIRQKSRQLSRLMSIQESSPLNSRQSSTLQRNSNSASDVDSSHYRSPMLKDGGLPTSVLQSSGPYLSECQACHIPYSKRRLPFQVTLTKCMICKRRYVPEILITNIEVPADLLTVGDSQLIEAHICRSKKSKDGESNASAISDVLPFIDYEIHRQLLMKLRIAGLNSIFGLKVKLCISETSILALATGTAFFLAALPSLPPLRLRSNMEVVDASDQQFVSLQNRIMELSSSNKSRIEMTRQEMLVRRRQLVNSSGNAVGGALSSITEDTSTPMMMTSPSTMNSYSVTGTSDVNSSLQTPNRSRKMSANLSREQELLSDNESLSSSDSDDQPSTNVIIQIDDDMDEDLVGLLLDPIYDSGDRTVERCNVSRCQFSYCSEMQFLTQFLTGNNCARAASSNFNYPVSGSNILKVEKDNSTIVYAADQRSMNIIKQISLGSVELRQNRQLTDIVNSVYMELKDQVKVLYKFAIISDINVNLTMLKKDAIDIVLSCYVVGLFSISMSYYEALQEKVRFSLLSDDEKNNQNADNCGMSNTSFNDIPLGKSTTVQTLNPLMRYSLFQPVTQEQPIITPLSHVPGRLITSHIDRICICLINEDLNVHMRGGQSGFGFHFENYSQNQNAASSSGGGRQNSSSGALAFPKKLLLLPLLGQSSSNAVVRQEDDLNIFIGQSAADIFAMVSAHCTSLDGDAVCSFKMEVCAVKEEGNGNRAYSLICISGDVVTLADQNHSPQRSADDSARPSEGRNEYGLKEPVGVKATDLKNNSVFVDSFCQVDMINAMWSTFAR